MQKKLLIIGGTGFIGRNLTIAATKEGYEVVVLSLNCPSIEQIIKNVEYIQADTTDFKLLQNKLAGLFFDYIINLSGYIDHSSFFNNGRKVLDSHFQSVLNILQLIDRDKLKKFVQVGSSDEYGNITAPQSEEMRESPISPYSVAKCASSHLLQMLYRTEKLPATILRLFLVYGPGQDCKRFLPQIITGCLKDETFPVSKGEQLRDFCYIDDITQGILQTLTNDEVNGEVINLASGKPYSIRNVIEIVNNAIGSGVPQFGVIPYRPSENMELYADTRKAERLLNWSPKININEGIIHTINYYREIYTV